jgi:hypothetical protein
MTRRMWQLTVLILPTVAALTATSVRAAPIVAGEDTVIGIALQSVVLYPGTPFNFGTSPFTVQLSATGSFTTIRETQVGTSINISNILADFKGTLPAPLPALSFDLESGTPELNPTAGTITNVVQNPADPGFASGNRSSFVSGDFSVDAYFKLVVAGVGTLYSDPSNGAVFTTPITGLPYPVGTVFPSPAAVNIYFELGTSPDPSTDPVIGQSFDRTVTVVPEPATLTSLAVGAMTIIGCGIWRLRKASASA